ncbi:hypothetical protein EMIT0P218_40030 [Pseudomonas sp. IT-P218]
MWRARKSLVKAFEPSSWAAPAVGPKQSRPRERNRSTTPATSGTSGPTMVRETFFSAKSASCSRASTSMATFSHLASMAVPALPGATNTFCTRGSWATFQARACSRPPLPMIKTFISKTSDDANSVERRWDAFLWELACRRCRQLGLSTKPRGCYRWQASSYSGS